MKEPIIERLEEKARQMTMRPAPAAHGGMSELWLALPFSILAFSAGAALARLIPALRWESLPILGVGIATAAFFFLLYRLIMRASAAAPTETVAIIGEGLKALLDSAGPAVVAMDTEGRLIYCNPSLERLLGYHASELMNISRKAEMEIQEIKSQLKEILGRLDELKPKR